MSVYGYVRISSKDQNPDRQIKALMERGVKFGRPKKTLTDEFDIAYKKWESGELSSREAAYLANMTHSIFYRRCKELQREKSCFIK